MKDTFFFFFLVEKEKMLLLRRPTTWGDGRLLSSDHLSCWLGARKLKVECQSALVILWRLVLSGLVGVISMVFCFCPLKALEFCGYTSCEFPVPQLQPKAGRAGWC